MKPLKNVYFFIFIIIFLLFACENQQKIDENITSEELSGLEIPQNTEALVTFLSGEAEVLNDGQWDSLFIGDLIETGKTVKVYESSFCELQFGDKAVVKIQENTELVLDTVFFEAGQTDITLDILAGTVLCKVDKLVGNENFNVKTNSSVCGVRGTEFMVKDDEKGTVLAVKEGRVAVLPATVDIDNLIAKMESDKISQENAEQIKTIINKIEESASIVSKDEEVVINSSTFNENTADSFNTVEQYIDEIITSEQLGSEEISVRSKENLSAKVESVISNVNIKGSEKELSQENREVLSEIDSMRIMNIKHNASAVNIQTEETEIEENDIFKISVNVSPSDSSIYLNEKLAGNGNYSGIFDEGTELKFKFSNEGYIEKTLNISALKNTQYNVVLEPEKVQELVVTEADNTAALDSTDSSGVKTDDTKPEQQNSNASEIKDQVDKENATVSEDKRMNTSETETTALSENNNSAVVSQSGNTGSNKEPIVNKYSVSNYNIIGNISEFNGKLFTADRRGTIVCSDLSNGKIIYRIPTGNNPNENSFPVVINNMLYFTGNVEFIIADADDGEVEEVIKLNSNTAHAYGQRLVRLSDEIGLFPAHDAIQFIDLSDGEVEKQIRIPNSLSMTPAVYEDKIFVANQNGVMLIIEPESGEIEKTVTTRVNMPIGISITIINAKAFFAGRMGNVVCYDIGAGNIAWERQLARGSSMYVFQDIEASRQGIYIISKGTLFGLSINNGNELFTPVSGVSSPPLYNDGRLFFGTESEQFVIMNSGNGAVLRSLYLGEKITTRPLFHNGNIVVGTEFGNVLVINPANM